MSGSDRGKRPEAVVAAIFCAVTIFGAVLLLYVLGVLNGREAERRDQTPVAYGQSAKADAKRVCVGMEASSAFECVYEKVEASHEQASTEQDLSAQQRAATSALASAAIAMLTLIVTGIGVWFVKRTLDATLKAVEDTAKATGAMERQNILAEDASHRQLRAYLSIENTRIGLYNLSIHPNGQKSFYEGNHGAFWFEIRNGGQTPAYDVCMVCRMEYSKPDVNSHRMIFRGRFNEKEGRALINPAGTIHNRTIFEIPEGYHSAIQAGMVIPVIAVILSYRDAFGVRHRTTGRYWYDAESHHEEGVSTLMTCKKGNAGN